MISYCVTVYNEHLEILKLLSILKGAKQQGDEIIVVQTYRDESEKSSETYIEIEKNCQLYSDKYYTFHFQNNFADMKNFMSSKADPNNKYIINFDADESIQIIMLMALRKMLETSDVDIFYVPRINIVEGITNEDIEKWSWRVNEKGWINWPDYQPRIYKNNGIIKWTGNVHEQLTGYNSRLLIEADGHIYIYHKKTIDKQRQQNKLYSTL